jgi:hypothetical protein
MTKLNDAIENLKERCSKEWATYGGNPLYWKLKEKLEALEFAQKTIEEDYVAKEKIEKLKETIHWKSHYAGEDVIKVLDELLKGGEYDKTK